MAYDIVFLEEEPGTARAVAESVFLRDLPASSKVFAFFTPARRTPRR